MRAYTQDQFRSWDDTPLVYKCWAATAPSNRAIILLHRGHEHSGRVQHLVDELGLDDVHCFAWDARGHGNSPGPRGYAENVQCLVKDLDALREVLLRESQEAGWRSIGEAPTPSLPGIAFESIELRRAGRSRGIMLMGGEGNVMAIVMDSTTDDAA